MKGEREQQQQQRPRSQNTTRCDRMDEGFARTLIRNDLSMYFFAALGSTSLDTMKRRKNSYTSWRCGHESSRLGSSSSGS